MVPTVASPLNAAENRRMRAWEALEPAARKAFGQFFTPAPLASHIADCLLLTEPTGGVARVLDPGAGVGSLGVALIERLARTFPDIRLHLTAVEADNNVIPALHEIRADTLRWAADVGVDLEFEIIEDDFIRWAADRYTGLVRGGRLFDYAIMNPPYAKIAARSLHRRITTHSACDVTNLYAAFVALSVEALSDGGRLAAITPRSFTNGPYFRAFRRFLDERATFERVDLFESRSSLFAESDVLQENVIYSLRRSLGARRPVSLRVHYKDGSTEASEVSYDDFMPHDDRERFIYLRADPGDHEVARKVNSLPCVLADLGVAVSTGRVVDFRSRKYLRMQPEPGSVPLLYPQHLRGGDVTWPLSGKKPDALMRTVATESMLFPAGHYVAVKRFTSKEERRRVAATLVPQERFTGDAVAFENHLNVFHSRGAGLGRDIAVGLTLYLSSTAVDRYFRTFSGHTQVNATDLRSIRYPSVATLRRLGTAGTRNPAEMGQDEIDAIVDRVVWSEQ